MNIRSCLLIIFSLSTTTLAWGASPYENLSFALRQQAIINDLRTHCRIPVSVTDARIESTFLASLDAHDPLLRAADALKAGKHNEYEHIITEIRCPDFN
ncbi:YicS family protein [Pantoea piersonii]|uniref:YicS family protein n=1 Tax=Pantoea piersonii TaxID=2364647 RepID=UPI0022F1D1DB|nr:YicS family protein [Pantoea piersonii]WBV23281.1 hypothetical protein PG877_09145 [Pantoea piersonii]